MIMMGASNREQSGVNYQGGKIPQKDAFLVEYSPGGEKKQF